MTLDTSRSPEPTGGAAGRIASMIVGWASAFGASLTATLAVVLELPTPALLLTAAVATLLLAVTVDAVRRLFVLSRPTTPDVEWRRRYAKRLSDLTRALRATSGEVDAILADLNAVSREREAAVSKLEVDLADLTSREQELQQRVDQLSGVPIPVAEHFARLMAIGEKRSARRDYLLFMLGATVSTLVSVIFFFLQPK